MMTKGIVKTTSQNTVVIVMQLEDDNVQMELQPDYEVSVSWEVSMEEAEILYEGLGKVLKK